MKKSALHTLSFLIAVFTLLVGGCKKADRTAPEITINGGAMQTISLQSTYTELGATATDDSGSEVELTTTGIVDTSLAGHYIITYKAEDKAGNISAVQKTVIVKNDAEWLAGPYNCEITSATPVVHYVQAITASTTVNNRILFSRFSDYAYNSRIYANVAGTTLTLPSQFTIQVGIPPNAHDRTFYGTGNITGTDFTLMYTDSINGSVVNKTETFVRQ